MVFVGVGNYRWSSELMTEVVARSSSLSSEHVVDVDCHWGCLLVMTTWVESLETLKGGREKEEKIKSSINV